MIKILRRLAFLVVFLVIAGLVFLWFWSHPAQTKPGALLGTGPVQRILPGQPIELAGHAMLPVALFQIDGRVLSRMTYMEGPEAKLSTLDLVLGWGPLAGEGEAGQLQFAQAARSYAWSGNAPPLDDLAIRRNSANIHIIPATPEVKAALEAVQPGAHVSLKGELLWIFNQSGWQWKSSLTRDDVGITASEIFYVRKAEVFALGDMPPPPPVAETTVAPDIVAPPVSSPTRPPRPAAHLSQPRQREVKLKFPLYVLLKHGSMTIPAKGTIVILEQRGENTKARYNGLTCWVETRDIQ